MNFLKQRETDMMTMNIFLIAIILNEFSPVNICFSLDTFVFA